MKLSSASERTSVVVVLIGIKTILLFTPDLKDTGEVIFLPVSSVSVCQILTFTLKLSWSLRGNRNQ